MTAPAPQAVIRPAQLAHLVFYTAQLDAMVHWYERVLGTEVAFRNERIAFLSFDEEHHRIALVAAEPYAAKPSAKQIGFYHAAFTHRHLADLIATYERLTAEGLQAVRTIHHGPTVSFYYEDPDRNLIELQVDTFPDAEQAVAWMRGPVFARNPVGVELDMARYLADFHAGVPLSELLRRPDDR
jgi:catechol-2,3-dioxygenase